MKNNEIEEDVTFQIRPSGRHLLTIGRELILDVQAAIVELVKNAYDADANKVEIKFLQTEGQDKTNQIMIKDDGHGMSRESVINHWLVPSTNNKKLRNVSPEGRLLQGKKGIGRYAAAVLGKDLLLETTDANGDTTTLYLDWKQFEESKYLDQVNVLVETNFTGDSKGTTLIINSPLSEYEWSNSDIAKLRKELKKLRTSVSSEDKDSLGKENELPLFDILLKVNIPSVEEINETIEPFPLFDYYDYYIKGSINSDGTSDIGYALNKGGEPVLEKISKKFSPTECGSLFFDIRVFDRDPDSISALIKKGLKDEEGEYLGKLEAKQLLNENCGIGVYRNGFRIRPLGDPDFDWLQLNRQRVQNPSEKIGSDQVIGFVLIESEDISGLTEKSARDGLKENVHFEKLKEITKEVISILELKRRIFRQKSGLNKSSLKIEKAFEKIFSSDNLKNRVRNRFKENNVPDNFANIVFEEIDRDEKDRNKVAEELKNAIAVYQGQATVGKIVHVIIHEGRRSLNYFVNQIPLLRGAISSFKESKDKDIGYLDKIYEKTEEIQRHGKLFSDLFKKLDPLASGSRQKPIEFLLKDSIEKSIRIFSSDIEKHKVSFRIEGIDELSIIGFPQDAMGLFTNLIENSLYWMDSSNVPVKEITIVGNINDYGVINFIDYRDSGPGIAADLIESEIIFEPNFSRKPNGTGLGLAIAGEVSHRLGFNLQALESGVGAYFRLAPRENINE